ncbi:hypothetical protein PVAP13_8KG155702 [Panicum virgatum]|uniref:Secreted protein n=1 Tax=Panicum virgatum TaxID=38727 RepID=A0A8T0PHA6_PANVG|nr:hypothetical protein PVAP13_8KG155702 [Panicum virgatum]
MCLWLSFFSCLFQSELQIQFQPYCFFLTPMNFSSSSLHFPAQDRSLHFSAQDRWCHRASLMSSLVTLDLSLMIYRVFHHN